MRTIACGKTARINLYRSGEFEIIFVGQRARMHFHFNKHEKLIYRFQSSYLGASKPIKDCEDNWQNWAVDSFGNMTSSSVDQGIAYGEISSNVWSGSNAKFRL